MRWMFLGTLLALAGCAATVPSPEPNVGSWKDCGPVGPCANPYQVKVVVVTMFERGADEGDAPGEFQFWKERQDLDTRIPLPHGHHDLFLNEATGVLGMVTGVGTMHSASTTMAVGLDPRLDLTEAYWLVAGIAGIDPADASIGSVAWSAHLVDGDLMHQIDIREAPEDWPFGYFSRRTQRPFDPNRSDNRGEHFLINVGLRDWAFALTKDLDLPAYPQLDAYRASFTEHPNAQRRPFVLTGGHLAAMTFWHGALLTDWANRYVSYWSDGETDLVTSAMEETGTYQSIWYLDRLGRVDKDRFMVLRGGSNYTMQPPGEDAASHLLKENEGYAGLEAALESVHLAGTVVVNALLDDWDRYRATVPGADDE